ncbi:ankyrin repeat protein, putative, partial [Bodo saltans]
SPASDLYSFGSMMCELFTGTPPWGLMVSSAIIACVTNGEFADGSRNVWPPIVPLIVRNLVRKLLSYSPDDRGTLDEAIEVLCAARNQINELSQGENEGEALPLWIKCGNSDILDPRLLDSIGSSVSFADAVQRLAKLSIPDERPEIARRRATTWQHTVDCAAKRHTRDSHVCNENCALESYTTESDICYVVNAVLSQSVSTIDNLKHIGPYVMHLKNATRKAGRAYNMKCGFRILFADEGTLLHSSFNKPECSFAPGSELHFFQFCSFSKSLDGIKRFKDLKDVQDLRPKIMFVCNKLTGYDIESQSAQGDQEREVLVLPPSFFTVFRTYRESPLMLIVEINQMDEVPKTYSTQLLVSGKGSDSLDQLTLPPLVVDLLTRSACEIDRSRSKVEILSVLKVLAAKLGDINALTSLLDLDAAVDFQDFNGWSPLCAAANGHQIEMMKVILDRKAVCSFVGSPTGTAFHVAIKEGYKDVLEVLLQRSAGAIYVESASKKTLHHFAVEHNRSTMLHALINRMPLGAGRTSECSHLLHVAAENGATDCCTTLLLLGAQVDFVFDGFQPIHRAAQGGCLAIVKQLLASKSELINELSKNGSTPLLAATSRGHAHVVKYLVKLGANVSIANKNGLTPLMVASAKGLELVVTELLATTEQHNEIHFVNQRVNEPNGSAAIHFAAHHGHAGVILQLRNAGADVNLVFRDATTTWNPLSLAAYFGHDGAVHALCKTISGRPPAMGGNGPNEDEHPMNVAARRAHTNVVEALFNFHFPVCGVAASGVPSSGSPRPPLICAAEKASYKASDEFRARLLKTMSTLLRLGASINEQDSTGRTALHWAVSMQNPQVVELLCKCSADRNIPDNSGTGQDF